MYEIISYNKNHFLKNRYTISRHNMTGVFLNGGEEEKVLFGVYCLIFIIMRATETNFLLIEILGVSYKEIIWMSFHHFTFWRVTFHLLDFKREGRFVSRKTNIFYKKFAWVRDINRFQHSPAYHLLYQQSLSVSCSTPSHTNIQDYPAVHLVIHIFKIIMQYIKSYIYSRLSCSTPSHTYIHDYPAVHLAIYIY